MWNEPCNYGEGNILNAYILKVSILKFCIILSYRVSDIGYHIITNYFNLSYEKINCTKARCPLKATNFYLQRINFLSQKLLSQTPVTFVSIIKNQFISIKSVHAEPWTVKTSCYVFLLP